MARTLRCFAAAAARLFLMCALGLPAIHAPAAVLHAQGAWGDFQIAATSLIPGATAQVEVLSQHWNEMVEINANGLEVRDDRWRSSPQPRPLTMDIARGPFHAVLSLENEMAGTTSLLAAPANQGWTNVHTGFTRQLRLGPMSELTATIDVSMSFDTGKPPVSQAMGHSNFWLTLSDETWDWHRDTLALDWGAAPGHAEDALTVTYRNLTDTPRVLVVGGSFDTFVQVAPVMQAVPEPAGCWMLLAGMLTLAARWSTALRRRLRAAVAAIGVLAACGLPSAHAATAQARATFGPVTVIDIATGAAAGPMEIPLSFIYGEVCSPLLDCVSQSIRTNNVDLLDPQHLSVGANWTEITLYGRDPRGTFTASAMTGELAEARTRGTMTLGMMVPAESELRVLVPVSVEVSLDGTSQAAYDIGASITLRDVPFGGEYSSAVRHQGVEAASLGWNRVIEVTFRNTYWLPSYQSFALDANAYAMDLVVEVPEPANYATLCAGLVLIGVLARRRTIFQIALRAVTVPA